MLRNKKVTILALAVMMVMALAVTVTTFSFAGKRAGTPVINEPDLPGSGTPTIVKTSTNIDYIIKNSVDKAADDMEYHVVEIGSGTSTMSVFADYKDSAGNKDSDFAKYVITGNKSISTADDMDPKQLDYHFFNVKEIDDNNKDALKTVAKADIIIISGGKDFSESNDLGEELYNLLHTYAIGDYKPIILEAPSTSNSGGSSTGGGSTGGTGATTSSTVANVVDNQMGPKGAYYATYGWDSSKSPEQFLSGVGYSSLYLGVNSRIAQDRWTRIYELDADGNVLSTKGAARVLVISATGSNGTLADKLFSTATLATTTNLKTKDGDTYKDITGTELETRLYNTTPDFLRIYSSRYNYRPGYVEVVNENISDIDSLSFDGYDLVILESDIKTTTIGETGYNRLVGAMKAKVQIVFDASLAGAQQNGPGNVSPVNPGQGGNSDDSTKSNYHQLYYMVATKDGLPMYDNVMITSPSDMSVIMNGKSGAICQPIAELINKSNYRGIGGPAGGSDKFTVLEIQPANPIDLTLAASNGNKYYTQGVNMAPSGTTKEELGETSTTEYYAWELSKAMIADALNMNYDDVDVVHVSVEELASKHEEYLGKYDMIYLGGNRSALMNGQPIYCATSEGPTPQNAWGMPGVVFTSLGQGGVGFKSGAWNSLAYSNGLKLFYGVDKVEGRDLSSYNLQELKRFADAGMPIIISSELANANKSGGTVTADSKMKTLLTDINGKANVLTLDSSISSVLLNYYTNDLGNTATGYVKVLDETHAAELLAFYNKADCKKRLRLAVTSRPPQYNLYDDETKLTTKQLSFKYEVNTTTSTAKLYIDESGNGAFEEAAVATGSNGSLKYDLSAYKGGLIYWKLEVSSGGSVASTTGATYIKPPKDTKQEVKVLQLLPEDFRQNPSYPGRDQQTWYGPQGAVSLIFCTECQRALMPIKYNPVVKDNDSYYYSQSQIYSGQDGVSNFGNSTLDANGNASNVTVNGSKVYMGKHEHKFGIVKYGGTGVYASNADNWDWNYADELSDMYDFHLDVMITRDFEALDARIKKDYTPLIGNATELAAARTAVNDATLAYNNYKDSTEYKQAVENVENVLKQRIKDDPANAEIYQRLIDQGCYYEFYSSFGTSDKANAHDPGLAFYNAYKAWVTANDKKINLDTARMEALYKYNFLKSEGKDWLSQADARDDSIPEDQRISASYNTIVIGAAENFGDDDLKSGDDQLKAYVENDGQVILFHETMSRFENYGPAKITAAVKPSAGLSNYYSGTQLLCANVYPHIQGPYQYAGLQGWQEIAKWANSASATKQPGTDRAVQNNKCNVTLYPFTLSDKLNITGTHPVAYALELDDVNVTPLYTLSTSSYQNEVQTIYAASPFDAQDNYFIYQAGHVFYCGAGHSKVTGINKDNNDERMLYINIICNSVKNTTVQPVEPKIEVFDYHEKDNDEVNVEIVPVDPDDLNQGYIYEIEEDEDGKFIPAFSFKATVDAGLSIQKVDIYYKVNPDFLKIGENDPLYEHRLAYKANDGDQYKDFYIIHDMGPSSIQAGELKKINGAYAGLEAKNEFFAPYGGNYTYIVIAVTDNKGVTKYQFIKVVKKMHLFDLT